MDGTDTISAGCFKQAFLEVWGVLESTYDSRLVDWYVDNSAWSDFMLKGKERGPTGGFVTALCEAISRQLPHMRLRVDPERHRVDAFLRALSDQEECYYNDEYLVMIEHENNRLSVHEEMWKLLHWRIPLKVLIFYDYAHADRALPLNKGSWLEGCLVRLGDMSRRYRAAGHGDSYLLIVGSREQRDGRERIEWKFFEYRGTPGAESFLSMN